MVGSSKRFTTAIVQDFSAFLYELEIASNKIKSFTNVEFIIFRGQPVDKDLCPRIGREGYMQKDITKREKDLINEFKRLSFPYMEKNSLTNWDLRAIAQHHFLPTRLLDWTENPLVALWFAFINTNTDDSDRVVWCFGFNKEDILDIVLDDKKNDEFYSHKRTIVYQPNHITRRIVNQTGWFTSHFYNPKNNKYSALNNLMRHWGHLYRISFPNKTKEFRDQILSQLNVYGINHYSVFPDLEGLCRYLDWKSFKN